MRLLVLGLLIAAAVLATNRAASAAPIAWCAEESGQRSRTCSFFTFEQCRAFVWGAGGYCVPNPYLAYGPHNAPRRVKRPRPYTPLPGRA
jgi:hypothetical protein